MLVKTPKLCATPWRSHKQVSWPSDRVRTHPSCLWGATRLAGGPLTFLGRQRVHEPQCQRGRPVPTQVGDGVQEGHVGASNEGVTNFSMEGHRGHIHAVQGHLGKRGGDQTKSLNSVGVQAAPTTALPENLEPVIKRITW